MPLLLLEGDPRGDDGKVLYITIEAIDEELLGFLDQCIEGVRKIHNTLKSAI